MAMPISKIIKFPIFQSSFNGVMKTATVKIINAIPKAMAMLPGFNCFSGGLYPAGRRRGIFTAKSGLTPVKHMGNRFICAGGLPCKR